MSRSFRPLWPGKRGLALVVALLAAPLAAQDARQILRDAEAKHRSRTQQYQGELTVTSKDGKVRSKGWRSFREGYAGDAKQLIRFVSPPEVKGVGFLSLGKPGKNPDQWLYLPSMKRERRIASQDRDSSFVGTDFTYEDMEEFDQSKYEVKAAGEETVDGQACALIDVEPRERSTYERKRLAVRKDNLYTIRVESFRKGEKEPAKVLSLHEVTQVDGHWVARKLVMRDVRKGSATTVLLQELAFDRPQPADRFTLQNLNREGGDE